MFSAQSCLWRRRHCRKRTAWWCGRSRSDTPTWHPLENRCSVLRRQPWFHLLAETIEDSREANPFRPTRKNNSFRHFKEIDSSRYILKVEFSNNCVPPDPIEDLEPNLNWSNLTVANADYQKISALNYLISAPILLGSDKIEAPCQSYHRFALRFLIWGMKQTLAYVFRD